MYICLHARPRHFPFSNSTLQHTALPLLFAASYLAWALLGCLATQLPSRALHIQTLHHLAGTSIPYHWISVAANRVLSILLP